MAPAGNKILLVGLGGQRCGSTWLSAYLASHDDVFVPAVKELHYFDARLLPDLRPGLMRGVVRRLTALSKRTHDGDPCRSTPDERARLDALKARIRMLNRDEDYLDYLVSRSGDAKVMCDITPEYSLLDRAGFQFVKQTYPAIRLAMVLRNPVDRVWSQVRLMARRGNIEPTESAVLELLSEPGEQRRNDYVRTLRELFTVFDRSLVFIEFFERLFNDAAVQRLCALLGLAFKPGRYAAGEHAGPALALPASLRARIYDRLRPVYESANGFFDGDIPETWKNDMRAFA